MTPEERTTLTIRKAEALSSLLIEQAKAMTGLLTDVPTHLGVSAMTATHYATYTAMLARPLSAFAEEDTP